MGPIDLLVNNAAIVGAPEPFWEHPASEWWRVFEVNVLGAFLCCHAVAAGMVERRRGRIVNVTSGAGYIPHLPAVGNDTSYPASKAALTRFTERLAEELAEYGVFAFAVAPGLDSLGHDGDPARDDSMDAARGTASADPRPRRG